MERLNRILNKVIMLGMNGYTEGSYTDLHVQQLIKIYSHPQNYTLEEGLGEKEISCDYAIVRNTNTGDDVLTAIEPAAIEDAGIVPEVTSPVG